MVVNSRLREFVLSRDDYTCQMCGDKPRPIDLFVHHKIKKSVFGKLRKLADNPLNLCLMCTHCHLPVESGSKYSVMNLLQRLGKDLEWYYGRLDALLIPHNRIVE